MFALILLVMTAAACAQPVFGPWTVHSADLRIQDVEVCVRGDTADVVFITPDSVHYVAFDLVSAQSSSLMSDSLGEDRPYASLVDLTAVSLEKWACLVHANTRGESWAYGYYLFSSWLVIGSFTEREIVEVESSSLSNFPDYHSGSWSEGLSLRSDHDRIAVSYLVADVGPFDVWYSASLCEYNFDADIMSQTQYVGGLGSTSNDPNNRFVAIPLANDSVLAFSNWGSNRRMFVGPWSEIESWVHTYLPFCGYFSQRELYLTASHRFITISDSNTLHQLIPLSPDTADCLPFAQIDDTWSPSWAFNPSYGFAALQATPGNLMLARIDTAGNEVQPVGMLYGTDGPPFIQDADVTITEDGKIVAVWSEFQDWNEGPRDLKIAWTDWTTFLATPDHTTPLVPNTLALSAYPNPFNSTVTIRYDLPQAGSVTLAVYDLQGRKVSTLMNEFAPSGSNELRWSPDQLASGVYFLTLEAPLATTTSKLLYLK
ncbi:MAG: T9SS type A sorting domain-containing protein [Calditrichaeota bacterium]|nr:T9SS type A sorting domain-containing protein [Calditrichota bacterium]